MFSVAAFFSSPSRSPFAFFHIRFPWLVARWTFSSRPCWDRHGTFSSLPSSSSVFPPFVLRRHLHARLITNSAASLFGRLPSSASAGLAALLHSRRVLWLGEVRVFQSRLTQALSISLQSAKSSTMPSYANYNTLALRLALRLQMAIACFTRSSLYTGQLFLRLTCTLLIIANFAPFCVTICSR